jgi:hypothetical protein
MRQDNLYAIRHLRWLGGLFWLFWVPFLLGYLPYYFC